LGYPFFHDEVLCTDTALKCSAGDDDLGSAASSGGVTDFKAFAETLCATWGQKPARHHLVLIDALQRVADGSTDRLMVQMPPGAAKSTYASVLFPAYWFASKPQSEVIAACHTASLAEHFGRRLRGVIAEQGAPFGLTLEANSRSAGRFSLTGGGQYFAAGVRGPITGRRADLILIDDPVKSWAEADSKVARRSLFDWYRAELLSRLKPGGRVVLIMTRWHVDDLAGRLMKEDQNWSTLRFPALAEADDPLGRVPGEALWPEWQTTAEIIRRRETVGKRVFSALYQQSPTVDQCEAFDVPLLGRFTGTPAVVRTVRAWDLAATVASPGRDPDWTVGLKLGALEDGRLVVLDVIRVRVGPAEVERLLVQTARGDGVATIISLAQDPGQAGVAQMAYLKRALSGFNVVSSPETGSKLVRALQSSAVIGRGGMLLVDARWTADFIEELQLFPNGDKDDQVDALSRAVTTIGEIPAVSRTALHTLMGR
jgi:predicted phage terminase large subunit-like protein